uniref:NADH-ubiquinone oxidoreductase chain 1 n=1 Tax=Panonychus ulmi TaxID=50024 RepID=D7SGS0_PANUL|nr:NADH dehydrogenase subunit 1 [Panonychus ulmi]ACD02440.1 NADH dehydrogenase subunit 1 [Panonychus ulmi]
MFLMQTFILFMSLITVMFITLTERKFLGILNNRKAPNFLLFMSIFQSLNDFLKLISKKILKMNFIMKIYWVMMIFFGMTMFLLIMLIFPLNNSLMYLYISFYMFFLIYSFMAFFFLILSYSSNSVYSIMAMTRVLIQIISYEVGMIFLFMLPLFVMNEFNFFFYYINNNMLLFFSMMYMIMLVMIVLSEMNRTPFDFLESETELVSGFNVEYFSSLFSFIFLVEYGFFLFMMFMISFFLKLDMFMNLLMIMMFIWTRAFMPRYRYDKMLNLFWKDLVLMVMVFFL